MNIVTKEEHQKIQSYAVWLVEQAGGSENADLPTIAAAIQQKFGISRDRARQNAAKAVRVVRGRERINDRRRIA